MEDITGKDGLVQKIIKDTVEKILGKELSEYIDSQKNNGKNVLCNGSAKKTVKTAYGDIYGQFVIEFGDRAKTV